MPELKPHWQKFEAFETPKGQDNGKSIVSRKEHGTRSKSHYPDQQSTTKNMKIAGEIGLKVVSAKAMLVP